MLDPVLRSSGRAANHPERRPELDIVALNTAEQRLDGLHGIAGAQVINGLTTGAFTASSLNGICE